MGIFSRMTSLTRQANMETPFQAKYEEIVIEKLPDGSSRTEVTKGAIYRASDGRLREERYIAGSENTVLQLASVYDPDARLLSVLDATSKTVHKIPFPGRPQSGPVRTLLAFGSADQVVGPVPQSGAVEAQRVSEAEDLGQREIEGLVCRGYRHVRRTLTEEFWVSPELGQVLLARTVGPNKESRFRLFEIRRIEPHTHLFTVSADSSDEGDPHENQVSEEESNDADRLLEAAASGKTHIIETLLAKGVELNSKTARGDTALLLAATFGQTDTVRLLIRAGAQLDARDRIGMTPLIRAASEGCTEAVQALLNAGADVNAKDVNGQTALMLAALRGHTETVKALLSAGADVNARNNREYTALMWAAGEGHDEIVRLLISAGASVSAKNKDGYTAFQIASLEGQDRVLQMLKEAGGGKE